MYLYCVNPSSHITYLYSRIFNFSKEKLKLLYLKIFRFLNKGPVTVFRLVGRGVFYFLATHQRHKPNNTEDVPLHVNPSSNITYLYNRIFNFSKEKLKLLYLKIFRFLNKGPLKGSVEMYILQHTISTY